ALAMPFLVLTATAYYDGKWRKFLISLCFLLLVKEVLVVSAISLGAFALIQRRPAKWILVPIALALGYGLFLRTWFFPMMLKDSTYYYDSFFGGWRAALARVGSTEAVLYISRVLLWAGAATVLSRPYYLLAVPCAGFYLLLGVGFTNTRSHYFLEPSFWIFFALVAGVLENIRNDVGFKPSREKWLFSFLACMFLMNMTLTQDLPFYRHHVLEKSYRAAIAALPTDANVGLGPAIEGHLYKVRRYNWLAYGGFTAKQPCTWRGEFNSLAGPGVAVQPGPSEYALLHKEFGAASFLPEEKEHIRKCWSDLMKDSTYGIVWEDSALILLKKRD
nr:DUF2079 domain-containing protein [Fibrobacterota bacterium]